MLSCKFNPEIHYSKEEIFAAKRQVVKAQVHRFNVTYHNYFERPETIQMVNYFFDKIYNLDAKAEWVDLAISSFDKIKSMIKEQTRESMERLIDLNNLTDKLDTQMAYLILEKKWEEGTDLTHELYNQYFIELGQAEERFKQVEISLAYTHYSLLSKRDIMHVFRLIMICLNHSLKKLIEKSMNF